MTCKDCIHGELCMSKTDTTPFAKTEYRDLDNVEEICEDFKNKTDYVEVVRCKDCKFRGTDDCSNSYYLECEGAYVDPMEDDDFCSCGERSHT